MNTRDEHLVKTKAELVKNLDIYRHLFRRRK